MNLPSHVRTPSARLAAIAAAATGTPGDHIDLAATCRASRRRIIAACHEGASGNKTRAAEALGLNRTTLIDKLQARGHRAAD